MVSLINGNNGSSPTCPTVLSVSAMDSQGHAVVSLLCGVPQGSVLRPVMFVLYTVDLITLIECHNLSPHLYADDTQVHGSCSPSSISTFSAQLIQCIDAVAGWMSSNRLQLNSDKTEVLWCSTSRRQSQLPRTPLPVGGTSVDPVRPPRSRPRHPHRLQPCDVFARSKNVGVLCSLETASADPSIHFADASGQSGAQQARLRQRCSGRPSSLLDAQATVSPECVSSTDLSASPLRPHL